MSNVPLIPGTYLLRCQGVGSIDALHDEILKRLWVICSDPLKLDCPCEVEYRCEGYSYVVNPLDTLGKALEYFKAVTEIWT